METTIVFALFLIVLLAVSFVSAKIPQMLYLNDEQTHLLFAFSAGIFLGALFLIFFPEGIEACEHAGFSVNVAFGIVFVGFLAVFITDRIFRHNNASVCCCSACVDRHSHGLTSLSTFFGLAIHAFFDGIALASSFQIGEDVGIMVMVAICVHKIVVIFSLSSVFLLSDRKKQARIFLAVFCFITPVAAAFTFVFLDNVSEAVSGVAMAISAGIFAFVTMCNMLPEAFHREKLDVKSLGLLVLGIAVALLATLITAHFGGHVH